MLHHVTSSASVLQLFTLYFDFCLLETLEHGFSSTNVHMNHLGDLVKMQVLRQEVWGGLRFSNSKETPLLVIWTAPLGSKVVE